MRQPSTDEKQDLLSGKLISELHGELQKRLVEDPASETSLLNKRLLEADLCLCTNDVAEFADHQNCRIAIVSLLFNWPSTGGGIVHTAE
ncbi:MAG: hypothetical protein ABI557_15640 [Aureliella sp.]